MLLLGEVMAAKAALKIGGLIVAAVTLLLGHARSAEREQPPLPEKQFASPEDRKAILAYRAQLAAFKAAHDPYEHKAKAYWELIAKKRVERRAKRAEGKRIELTDYVLDQPPPIYSGPPWPAPPPALTRSQKPKKKPPVRPMPVVADFLKQAKIHFDFVPEKPAAEIDYKRAYARVALEAGLSKEQAVRIYSFETGGNGHYDVQAGLETKSKNAKPISTALGYNQLLVANTLGLLVEQGEAFIETLKTRMASAKSERHKKLAQKIAALRRMVKYAHSFPNRWSVHVREANSMKGWGVHALNLDIDIGPLLQTQKLVTSIAFAKHKGYASTLSAAELEMMNLTGDGSGFDMVTIPRDRRDKIPTANFFEPGGYYRNPVAIRNNVAASLLAATDRNMDNHSSLDGTKEMAAAFEDAAKTPPAKPAAANGASQ
jgi:hypothetical protein